MPHQNEHSKSTNKTPPKKSHGKNVKNNRLIIFAKAPIEGFSKTRLIPALGEKRTAKLAKQLLAHTLANCCSAKFTQLELCVTPEPSHPVWQTISVPDSFIWSAQTSGDLGERIINALGAMHTKEKVLPSREEAVVLIGTDCPEITSMVLDQVTEILFNRDAVIIPANDGGYVLLGFNRFHPSLFEGIRWSTDKVFSDTVQRMQKLNWSFETLAPMTDIDTSEDLHLLPSSWYE